jgi:hypothetical protein
MRWQLAYTIVRCARQTTIRHVDRAWRGLVAVWEQCTHTRHTETGVSESEIYFDYPIVSQSTGSSPRPRAAPRRGEPSRTAARAAPVRDSAVARPRVSHFGPGRVRRADEERASSDPHKLNEGPAEQSDPSI